MMLFFAVVLGYLFGSIPTGYLIGKSRGVDVRKFGSGGTGGTNVFRTLGKGAAIATGLVDVLKGTLAAYVGFRIAGDWGYALAGIAALVGHSYPVWLGFRGGKSVATGAGALAVFYWPQFLVALVIGIPAIAMTRWVSLGSLLGGLAYSVSAIIWAKHPSHILLVVVAYGVVVVRHWSNIKRILNGTENRFGEKAKEIK